MARYELAENEFRTIEPSSTINRRAEGRRHRFGKCSTPSCGSFAREPKGGAVEEWQPSRAGRMRLLYLPRHRPELDPGEYLNNGVEDNAPGRRRAGNREDSIAGIRGRLRSAQRQPDVVESLFEAQPARYAES